MSILISRWGGQLTCGSTDNDSYHYACAGKHIVTLTVHVFDKNVSLFPGVGVARIGKGKLPSRLQHMTRDGRESQVLLGIK